MLSQSAIRNPQTPAIGAVKTAARLLEENKVARDFVEHFGLRLRRGSISEISGEPGSGKTALTVGLLSELTRSGEICAIVDVSDCFNPEGARENGLVLENVLWIRCGGDLEKSFTITDYLVQAKGFGAIWLNLSLVPGGQLDFVPQSFWYRFRTGVNSSPTLLIVTVRSPLTGSACGRAYSVSRRKAIWKGLGRFRLLREFLADVRSRKPLFGETVPARISQNREYV